MAYIVKIDEKKYKVDIKNISNNFSILLNNRKIQAEVVSNNGSQMTLFIDNKFYNIVSENENQISVNNEDYAVGVVDEQIQKMLKTSPDSAQKKEVIVSAPMPGLIVEIEVKEGDKVSANQGIMIVEAMKMQNEMKSPKDGIVKKIYVKNGQTVNSGDSLISIE